MGTEYIQCKEGDPIVSGDIVYTSHTPITRMAEVVAGPGQLGSACVIKYSDTGAWNVLPVTFLQKKREMVKREGWVNIYTDRLAGWICDTRKLADEQATPDRIACGHVEWEEPA